MARWSLLCILALAAPVVAAPVPKAVLTPALEAEFDRLWDATGRIAATAECYHLYCRLVTQPDAAVEYLTKRLPPAAMTKGEAKELLTALASEKAEVWKPAFRALAVRDVRLALKATNAWELDSSDAYHNRLGPLLSGHFGSPDLLPERVQFTLIETEHPVMKYQIVSQLGQPEQHGYYVGETYAKAVSFDRFCATRTRMAAGVLERIGTPAARAHLKALAGGHEASMGRMAAKESLDRLDLVTVHQNWKLADAWRQYPAEFAMTATADRLLASPKETVAFLKEKLKPITLSKKDGQKLLAKLFSDDEKEMQAAMKEIQYYDLRLAMSVEDAWAEANSAVRRCRLVKAMGLATVINEDLTDFDKKNDHLDYTFQPPGGTYPGRWHVVSEPRNGPKNVPMLGFGNSSQLDNTLEELGNEGNFRWLREECSIYVLDAIGTDDAIDIIKDMATGHPDAGPTKEAKAVLKRRGIK